MRKKIYTVIILVISICLIGFFVFHSESLPANVRINRIVILKSKRLMMVYHDQNLLKTYKIALGGQPIGKKCFEGDNKTPEGIYYIDSRNPNSDFHLNLGISYPNAADSAFAKAQGKAPGGDIKIHGLRNGKGYIGRFHRLKDWTAGCIAVTNSEIEELFASVDTGAEVDIRP